MAKKKRTKSKAKASAKKPDPEKQGAETTTRKKRASTRFTIMALGHDSRVIEDVDDSTSGWKRLNSESFIRDHPDLFGVQLHVVSAHEVHSVTWYKREAPPNEKQREELSKLHQLKTDCKDRDMQEDIGKLIMKYSGGDDIDIESVDTVGYFSPKEEAESLSKSDLEEEEFKALTEDPAPAQEIKTPETEKREIRESSRNSGPAEVDVSLTGETTFDIPALPEPSMKDVLPSPPPPPPFATPKDAV